MRVIDRTREAMGWSHPWQIRRENQIQNIGIHHSATADGNMRAFENHWRSLGWRNGGYSEIILRNGDVELCYVPTIVTNGISNHNLNTYHICIVGNSSFTAAGERSLIDRIKHNMSRFNVPVERVMGHNEFSGHRSNICPGRNTIHLRNSLRASSANNYRNSLPTAHRVAAGETLFGIAQRYQTTVAELQRLNHISNPNLIRVGQALNLPNTSNLNRNMHHVTRATPGFITAADAASGRNPQRTVTPGMYYVFNQAGGMINVTTKRNMPGSWINPNK